MSEPRRSTRARAREEAAPPPPSTPKDTPTKPPSKSLKRKRPSIAPSKDATPGRGTPVAEGPQQPSQPMLPLRVVDGQPLPTLSEPQSLDLSSQEYQDIQHSGVLSASLQRSRAIWVSGTNFRLFHAFFTPPKKVADRTEEDKQNIQRQKEIVRNFPQVGEAQLVIEPHTFPIRLYGPREAVRQVQKKAPTYGQWPNHNQQSPYQYNHPPPQHQPPPPPRPPQPKPQPQKAPPPPQAPAPDPVIHMLAQRAGQDPELKAVMKIVAAGQATKEQLEFFQGHISELTNILQKQKEAGIQQAPHQPGPAPPPPKPAAAPRPQPIAPPPQPVAPTPPPPPQQQQQLIPPKQPPPTPTPNPPHVHQPQMAPRPPPPPGPPHLSHPPNYNHKPPYNQPPQYHQHHAQQYPAYQAPRVTYRPLVFDFKEGNGDKFYFPTYSFMEWLPNNSGAKFSFLVTKMKPKPPPAADMKPPATPAPKAAPSPAAAAAASTVPTPTPAGDATSTATPSSALQNVATPGPTQATPAATTTPAPISLPPATPYVPPPRIEDFDEKADIKDIDFYQPVTVLVMSGHPDILQSLPRAIRPPDAVEKYMNQVFDTCRRAEETFLAFRLPKEGGAEAENEEKKAKSGDATPVVRAAENDVLMGGTSHFGTDKKKVTGRPRKSIAV
ncbi:uncharacterized protein CC84DRAFT_1161437 [Paraphaeosphaeria sporulosa]|uniref:SWR1-complex protein 3 domain-containing protein n=1 Tax=Paraphaeosphaeria sporulosa TaxID=1460663 RepID=A0A177CTI2_9PLEO|nr:uncharacterized protein CC84DRAFT_1161437 [Paraphaeosphaeria sporulosa]OAG10501.1 hypothetical protein CC84DRAFT_1161437 [Paraphaeosphaeria sporulosa]